MIKANLHQPPPKPKMIRFLALPILAGLVAAILTAIAIRYMPAELQVASGPNATLIIVTAGAVTLAIASYATFVRFGLAFLQRTEGLAAFEADMRRRIARLESGMEQGVETRMAVNAIGHARGHAANETPAESKAGSVGAPQAGEPGSESDKVIQFDPAARGHGAHLPQARLIGARLAQALDRNQIEAWFQPIVSLPGRKTRFFEAVAYLTEAPEGKAKHAAQSDEGSDIGRAIEPAYSSAPEIDRRMLLQSMRLLRELDRTGKHAGVIWRLHQTTLADTHAFAGIERILDANGALGGRLIARIDHRDYASLDAAQTDRLHRLREMGFTLAIGNCPDTRSAREAVKSNLFAIVIIDIARIVVDDGEERPIHRVVARGQGHPEVEIIASGVSDEQQAMALIDQDILLAQGDFFSEPRPMRRNGG